MNPNYPEQQDRFGGVQGPQQADNPMYSAPEQPVVPLQNEQVSPSASQAADMYNPAPSSAAPPPSPAAQPMQQAWHSQPQFRDYRSSRTFAARGNAPYAQSYGQAPSQQQEAMPGPGGSTYTAQQRSYRSARKWFKPTFYVPVLLVLTVLGGGAATFAFWQSRSDPDTVFRTSLSNSLSTTSFKQASSQPGELASVTAVISYDTKDVRKPVVHTTGTIDAQKALISFEGYGTADNTYTKVLKAESKDSSGQNSLVPLNKWLQVDGKDPVESMTALTPMYDPRYLMLGDYITGNFTKTQRNQLIEYVTQHKVYEYDPAKVTKKSEAGKDFYVYHAKVDSDKLYEYNRLAASFMGLDASLVKDMLDVQGTREVTLLIDIKEEYLAKVVTDNVTTIYSGWNATKLPDEPKPAAAYNEFQQQSLESGAPRSTSSDSLSERAKDVFRQNNVMTLVTLVEKYYAENSFFPTLAELNDPAWVRSNLPELDSSTLKDPDGTTEMLAAKPTKGAYSYQVSADDSLSSCDNQEIFCYNYRITAFLSNGTAYVQTSEG